MNILYATDGSESALAGASFLTHLPLDDASDIRVLTVEQKGNTPEAATHTLEEAIAALQNSRARLSQSVRHGHPADELLHDASEKPTDLIVVGTKGRSAVARFFLGSVAERVARHASCSVLVARPLPGPLRSIVVGVDNSSGADRAVRFLASLPLPPACRIHLVSVVFPEAVTESARHMLLPNLADQVWQLSQQERAAAQASLEKAAAFLTTSCPKGTPISTHIRTGAATVEILAAAEKADLVVVGAQGLSELDRFLLGSVTERLLRHAPCSVLCVRSADQA